MTVDPEQYIALLKYDANFIVVLQDRTPVDGPELVGTLLGENVYLNRE